MFNIDLWGSGVGDGHRLRGDRIFGPSTAVFSGQFHPPGPVRALRCRLDARGEERGVPSVPKTTGLGRLGILVHGQSYGVDLGPLRDSEAMPWGGPSGVGGELPVGSGSSTTLHSRSLHGTVV